MGSEFQYPHPNSRDVPTSMVPCLVATYEIYVLVLPSSHICIIKEDADSPQPYRCPQLLGGRRFNEVRSRIVPYGIRYHSSDRPGDLPGHLGGAGTGSDESPEQWRQRALELGEDWQVPNCVTATGGKHVALEKPANTGSTNFNYEVFFSIV